MVLYLFEAVNEVVELGLRSVLSPGVVCQVDVRGGLTSWPARAPLSATCLEVAHGMNSQAVPFFSEAAFMARAQIQMSDSKLVALGACSGGAKAILPDAGFPATSFQKPNI
ncbi:hypothetical protein, partial [Mesorhizobium sp. M7A.F.Ca.CA.004.12.1.1]